jgi:hypothetical protein
VRLDVRDGVARVEGLLQIQRFEHRQQELEALCMHISVPVCSGLNVGDGVACGGDTCGYRLVHNRQAETSLRSHVQHV